jgi:RNA polymerase sigma factor (sigma-70 family)
MSQDELLVLYREQWLGLVRLSTLMVGDQRLAEDVVQDVFVGMQRNLPIVDAGRHVGYLRAAVLNRSRNSRSRRREWEELAVADRASGYRMSSDALLGPEGAAESADRRVRLLAAVRGLPDRQREVLVLRYWMQLSEHEIAEALGVSPGTVKSSASRGLKSLAEHVGELR